MSRSDGSPIGQSASTPSLGGTALDYSSPGRLSGELAHPPNSGRRAPSSSGSNALEMPPGSIDMDTIRKVCRDEMKAEIEGLRASISQLEWRLQCSSLTINADLCDLKRQVQVMHVEKQGTETPRDAENRHEEPLRHEATKPLKEPRDVFSDFSLQHLKNSQEPLPETVTSPSFRRHPKGSSSEVFHKNPEGIFHKHKSAVQRDHSLKPEVDPLLDNNFGDDSVCSEDNFVAYSAVSRQDLGTSMELDAELETPCLEYDEILENARQRRSLKADCWAATTLMVVKDLAEYETGNKDGRSRIALVTVCLFLNLFMQIGLVQYLCRHVVLPQITHVQIEYKQFHKEAFVSGHFERQTWDSLETLKDDICGIAFGAPYFMCACIFLWWARCILELSQIAKRLKECRLLPDLPPEVPPTFMVWKSHQEDLIVCLNRKTRFLLYLVVHVPRLTVGMSMLFMGTAFLTASESFADLILNTLAMSFVFDIDELLFGAFMPVKLSKALDRTKIAWPQGVDDSLLHRLHLTKVDPKSEHISYWGALAFVVAALILILCWKRYQFVLPAYSADLQMACDSHLQALTHVPCKPWDFNCFPE